MRNYKLFALLCVLGLSFASCKENSKSEWSNFYGYTNEDIIGTYSYSNVKDAFENVVGTNRYVCEDAEIEIKPDMGSTIEFKINCPSQSFSRSFNGKPTPNNNDFMLHMTSGYQYSGAGKLKAYNVNGYVLKNEKQQLRMHGYTALNTYIIVQTPEGIDTIQDDGTYYYFDVIKN